ncbi:MAG: AzlD domain-containing protein [Desulfobacteraceae bacterium]|nr:AzlD domain-containing protein [Desulfobacteraceae bacterium]
MIPFDVAPMAAVAVMTIVTYLTRISGVFIMARAGRSRRLEIFCHALSGSVIVALLVPVIASGDWIFRLAVAMAGAVMAATGNSLLAMVTGAAAASVFRLWC